MGTKELKYVRRGEKYFVLGRLEQPRQNKPAQQAQRTNEPRKDLFHLSSLSQGPPLSSFSLSDTETTPVPALHTVHSALPHDSIQGMGPQLDTH
jgi:hypothetical protein